MSVSIRKSRTVLMPGKQVTRSRHTQTSCAIYSHTVKDMAVVSEYLSLCLSVVVWSATYVYTRTVGGVGHDIFPRGALHHARVLATAVPLVAVHVVVCREQHRFRQSILERVAILTPRETNA